MNKQLVSKIKEGFISVIPIPIIVILLNFTQLLNLSITDLQIFLICSVVLIISIALFNLGADLALTQMGEYVGSCLTKSKKLGILVIVVFFLGFLITIAEPDLSVLAKQVEEIINGKLLIVCVGVGVGIFLVLAILKIIFKKQLSTMLMFFYMLLFSICSLVFISGNENLLALCFDSGGVTTGPITVPFIMALGVGVSYTIGGNNANENSFGLVALCSIGPILAILILVLFSDNSISYEIPEVYLTSSDIFNYVFTTLGSVTKEVSIALSLIVVFFFTVQFFYLRLPKKKIIKTIFGILFTHIGLILFLTSVNIGFMPVGYQLGLSLGNNPYILPIIAFIIGMVVVLAEPAVHVLNKQVEVITSGTVSKRSMLIALSIGVGVSICLSMIRIIFNFSILYYLIPGYFISLGLSFFVPKIYTAIAFDSGGVASGPVTSTFILPLAVGACMSISGQENIMSNAFGIVAMVAMTPLITIQVLGFKAIISKRLRQNKAIKQILISDDNQIINFM